MHAQRRNSLRRIARWVTGLLGHADLTPSDSAIALVLTATLQRQCRRRAARRGAGARAGRAYLCAGSAPAATLPSTASQAMRSPRPRVSARCLSSAAPLLAKCCTVAKRPRLLVCVCPGPLLKRT
jgi:hypothetical protein